MAVVAVKLPLLHPYWIKRRKVSPPPKTAVVCRSRVEKIDYSAGDFARASCFCWGAVACDIFFIFLVGVGVWEEVEWRGVAAP